MGQNNKNQQENEDTTEQKKEEGFDQSQKSVEIISSGLDLSKLRLSQHFSEFAGANKIITNIPTRKPHRQEYVRVNPDPEFSFKTAILEMKIDQTLYIVDPSLWDEFQGEISHMELFTTINRQKVLSLWPVKLPDSQGRQNPWHKSAYDAAGMAMKKWIKIVANRSLGAYEVYQALGELSEPEWPDLTFSEILNIALGDRYINTLDHPVIRDLRGET